MRQRPTRIRRLLLLASGAAAATLGAGGVAAAQPSEIVPGVTYERIGRPGQVIHVARIVPGPLVSVRPVMTGGAPTRRTPLTAAMGLRLGDGAVIGVNGDYFNLDNDYPSGLLITAGELVSEPEPTRSALLFPPDGTFLAARLELKGTWLAAPDPASPQPFPERTFVGVNRPAERAGETLVYTPAYGDVTPVGDRIDALIALDPPGLPAVNQPLTGTVQTIQPGGGTGIGPGKLVLSGPGSAGDGVLSDLVVGRRVTLAFAIAGVPAGTAYGVGGGPALVENGIPLSTVSEGFTSGQIATRTSRTAVGQTADGTVLLVTAEGPRLGSRGIGMAEQAALMASLGARTAVGMDGGGSAMMAVRDRLVTAWPSERAISNAVVVSYGGVQLTQPATFVSPNGDRVDDSTRTTARSPRTGMVRITLARPNGRTARELYEGPLGPSGRRVTLGARNLRVRDGRYRVMARFTPDDGSAATLHGYDVVVDRTLGFLRLRKVGRGTSTSLRIGFRLAKAARVTIVARDARGRSVKLLLRDRRLRPGRRTVMWDLRRRGKPLKPGIYTVGVRVRTPNGRPGLAARVRVTKPKPRAVPAA